MRGQIRRLMGVVLFASAAGAGCDDGTPYASSSTEQAQVSGKVTYRGKPITKAEIIFNPANINRKTAPQATAPLKDDGTYEITTLIGENIITFGGAGVAKNNETLYASRSYEVKPGPNSFDITLP